MVDFQYKRAPITEAVVEFKFSAPTAEKKRNKGLKRLSKLYVEHKPVARRNFKVEIQPTGSANLETSESTIDRFNSADMTQQLHVGPQSFLISQLAPYEGWNNFRDRLNRDWEAWKKSAGFHAIERVGVRYINRIDLPVEESLVHYEDYLSIYPLVPDTLSPTLSHSMSVRIPLRDMEAELNLKSAAVDSPLPDHMAILLDFDIVRTYKDAPSDDELFSFIEQAREKKNQVFEACITDKARRLFS